MDVQAALLAAIADRPGDDTPRLAYADWLDDHAGDLPDPDAARARSDFIRVQCAVSQLADLPSAAQQGFADLYRRQDALLTLHRRDLLGPLADDLGPHDAVFDRGFLTEIELDANAFVNHAAALAALIPRPDIMVSADFPSREFLGSPHLGLVTSLIWSSLAVAADYSPFRRPPPRPKWDRLRVLTMARCDLDDLAVGEFANEYHADYPALSDVDVSWNRLSDEGVRALVNSPLWPRLRVLAIWGNPISDVGAATLADAPPTVLEYLDVAQTGITRVGQARLLRRKEWEVKLF